MKTDRTVGWAGLAAFLAGCTGTVASSDPTAGHGAQAGSIAALGGAGGSSTGGSEQTEGGSGADLGAGGTPDAPTPDPGSALPYEPPRAGQEALPARTWKLTHAQYRKTVEALLGVSVDTADLEPDLDN